MRRGAGKKRWLRRIAWLAVALVLSLTQMPCPRAMPMPAAHAHHHHHHQPCGGEAPKGGEGHQGCPFCTAHPGYSPPPPQMAALPMPVAAPVVSPPVAMAWIAPAASRFLTSLRPRAPPAVLG